MMVGVEDIKGASMGLETKDTRRRISVDVVQSEPRGAVSRCPMGVAIARSVAPLVAQTGEARQVAKMGKITRGWMNRRKR